MVTQNRFAQNRFAQNRFDNRLFFALDLDTAIKKKLIQLQKQFPLTTQLNATAIRVPEYNFHLTLFFLGASTKESQACFESAADSISLPAFTLQLSLFGLFEKPGIIWFGLKEKNPALTALHHQLCHVLTQCGQSKPEKFIPHITLFRKAAVSQLPDTAPLIECHISCFSLMRSTPQLHNKQLSGVRYDSIHDYPLYS